MSEIGECKKLVYDALEGHSEHADGLVREPRKGPVAETSQEYTAEQIEDYSKNMETLDPKKSYCLNCSIPRESVRIIRQLQGENAELAEIVRVFQET